MSRRSRSKPAPSPTKTSKTRAFKSPGPRAKRATPKLADAKLAAALQAERSKRRDAESELKRLRSAVTGRERWLLDAIDRLPIGFAMFDADDRLVVCNRLYGHFHRDIPIARPGLSYSEILRMAMDSVIDPEMMKPDREAWFRWRMARHLDPAEPVEVVYRDGRVCQMIEARTREGGIIQIRSDVTDIRRVEGEARRGRALLKSMFDSVPALINIKDLDLRYLLVNRAMVEWLPASLGIRSPAEAIGKTASELFGHGRGGRAEELDREVLRTGRSVPFVEFDDVNAKGEPAVVAMHKAPVRDDRGNLIGVLTVNFDVTDLRRAQADARRMDERLADYAQTSSDWFWETGPDHRFTLISEGARMVNSNPNSLIGLCRWESPQLADREHAKWSEHRADHEARRAFRDFTYSVKTAGGATYHIAVSGKPVFDPEGNFQGYRGSGREVTHQVKLERELIAAKEQAEAASRAKSEFLASMSHELRTPLNAIMGFAEVLMSELIGPLGEPRYREYARDIHMSGSHLLDVISDVLDMAKIEARRFEVHPIELSLSAEVDSCLSMVAETARSAGLHLANEMAVYSMRCVADRRALRQILLNLLSNAIKFTPKGGRVSIQADSVKEASGQAMVRITMTDTGIGIPPDQLPRLGRPFEQVASVFDRRQSGSGLGLALSRSLVEMHGGHLNIASRVGEGTKVEIWLPLKQAKSA